MGSAASGNSGILKRERNARKAAKRSPLLFATSGIFRVFRVFNQSLRDATSSAIQFNPVQSSSIQFNPVQSN
jgi:hypothetical protein